MRKLSILLMVIGSLQIVLGLAYLFAPAFFLQVMGHSIPNADLYYPLGMLAARFIAYGLALFVVAKAPSGQELWINTMILIQLIDLSVGIFYTSTTVVPLSLSAFPMFNATLIILLSLLWHPKKQRGLTARINN